MKIVKTIDGKQYLVDTETKTMEEVTVEEEEKETVEEEKEEKVEEEKEDTDEAIQKAAEEVVAGLGLDAIQKQLAELNNKLDKKEVKKDKKTSDLLDLEALMKKDVSEMTAKEKTIGFFQAILQNNKTVLKALSEGTPADGGYLFPDEFRSEIVRDIAEGPYMRREVRVIPMKRDVMNMPSLASKPKVTWTEENAVKSTTTAHFGTLTLTVKKMASILYASDELIEDSTEVDVVQLIISLFSEAIGEEEDRVICQGNGTTQPTGLTTARVAATIQSVACDGNLSFDNILNVMYLLPSKYHKNAKFFVNRANIRELRKLKDGDNRYLWAEPVAAGVPPTIFGHPVIEANDLPESELYFGDMKKAYWLGDRHQMRVKISQDTTQAFQQDETAIRVVERIAGNVILGAALRALITIP